LVGWLVVVGRGPPSLTDWSWSTGRGGWGSRKSERAPDLKTSNKAGESDATVAVATSTGVCSRTDGRAAAAAVLDGAAGTNEGTKERRRGDTAGWPPLEEEDSEEEVLRRRRMLFLLVVLFALGY